MLLESFSALAFLVLVGFVPFATPRPAGTPPTEGEATPSTSAEGPHGQISEALRNMPLFSPPSFAYAGGFPILPPPTPLGQSSASHWPQQGFAHPFTPSTNVVPGFAAPAAFPPVAGRPGWHVGLSPHQGEAGPSTPAGALHGPVHRPPYSGPPHYPQSSSFAGPSGVLPTAQQPRTQQSRSRRARTQQPRSRPPRSRPPRSRQDRPSSSRVPPAAPDVPGTSHSAGLTDAGSNLVPVDPSKEGQGLTNWLNDMRRALGNRMLQFFVADGQTPAFSRVFVARHGSEPQDHLLYTGLQEESSSGEEANHLVRQIEVGRIYKPTTALLGDPPKRTYVYLNSRANTKYLNQQYFEGRLHFFPLNNNELIWDRLNPLFKEGRVVALPPRLAHGLPLLVRGHTPNTAMMNRIQAMTGVWKGDTRQVVSLWSPVLHSKDRTTIVLYGIAQVDMRDHTDFSNRIINMAKNYKDVPGSAFYHIDHDFPPELLEVLQKEVANAKQ